jgi:hypothetical protein
MIARRYTNTVAKRKIKQKVAKRQANRTNSDASPAVNAKGGYPDFRRQTVVLFCRGRAEVYPIVLANPRFEMQAGRLFLLGVTPQRDSVGGWADNVPRGVAWAAVESYLVFPCTREYLARLSKPDSDDGTS